MENNDLGEIFNDNNLDKAIKKGKRKTFIKVSAISLVIAVIVFFAGQYINTEVTMGMEEEAYNYNKMLVELGIPNGYISESYTTLGFLGGYSIYEISRNVGSRSVVLEDRYFAFGKQRVMTRVSGYHTSPNEGEWTNYYWENGYEKMIFFHPNISYKEYKNDLQLLEDLPDGKLIEMGISFEQPYTYDEVLNLILPELNISWYWIDSYSEEDLYGYKSYAEGIGNTLSQKAYILENEVLGLGFMQNRYYGENSISEFDYKYNALLETLQNSNDKKHNDTYQTLVNNGYTDASNVPILGVIVYGTKDELKELVDNPHIKATSFGVIIDNY